ncbi:helix-turn-helix domain-containing protein [Pseudarthrobacter sulfonivorans]|uniref:helix-turn-helix domain-containing protein n=1 Tax=Pseudarthrobacter sulfonivorans TaxID=121292 RepID=UPI0028600779|nr:helix-turn-helix domain-containing protein [Pseudarthrobacter sulfonivorans]MDR6417566.1 excisionase family DNA binding protein [Pseudarthrobacter sulfonivorans]
MSDEPMKHRFLTIEHAAEELNVSDSQIRALLRTGELRGIQVGGRGVWRIGVNDVEDFITAAYKRTSERIAVGDLKDDSEATDF